MKKENENIHLFIIQEEYKRNKPKQNRDAECLSGKKETPIFNSQNDAAIIRKLAEMHSNPAVIEDPEPIQTDEEPEQVSNPQIGKLPDAPNLSDLLASFQRMKTERQGLLQTKQSIVTTERDLEVKLAKELDKTQMEIDELKSEIPYLERTCREMAEALGLPHFI